MFILSCVQRETKTGHWQNQNLLGQIYLRQCKEVKKLMHEHVVLVWQVNVYTFQKDCTFCLYNMHNMLIPPQEETLCSLQLDGKTVCFHRCRPRRLPKKKTRWKNIGISGTGKNITPYYVFCPLSNFCFYPMKFWIVSSLWIMSEDKRIQNDGIRWEKNP